MKQIIPRSFQEWDDLALELILGNQHLDKSIQLFGILGNRQNRPTFSSKNLEREIHMLQDTTDLVDKLGLENLKNHKDYKRVNNVNGLQRYWARIALSDIREIRFLERLKVWVPSILKFFMISKDYLFCQENGDVRPNEGDELIQKLEKDAETINNSNKIWQFGSVLPSLQPYKHILNDVSSDHQDFVSTFVSRREALIWMLTHTDNENFDKKLRLVRPNTDDEVLLR